MHKAFKAQYLPWLGVAPGAKTRWSKDGTWANVTGGLKMLNSCGIKMSTCQSLISKIRGCVDAGPRGVPHVARSIQRGIELQRDRQNVQGVAMDQWEVPALSGSSRAS